MVDGGLFKGELRLADGCHNGVDELDDLHVGLVRDADAFENDILRRFLGLGLDHDDLLEGGGDADKAVGGIALVCRGVDNIFTAHIGDVGGGDGAVPGDVGAGDGNGRAERGDDLHGIVIVVGQHGAGDDDVVAQLVIKQRAHRTVDDAAVEDAALGGLALAAVEAAGDPADGVHPLLKLDGEGEVVNAGLGVGRAGDGGENGGVAVAADALGIGKLRDLTGFYGKGATADHRLEYMMVGILLSGNHWMTSC